jgi:Uma2 family endonuclease
LLPIADYRTAHPRNAYLIIEVAQSSLELDRGRKARLYAQCQVPEYWIVNLIEGVVEVQREPRDGRYQRIATFDRGATLRPLAFPEDELQVSDFLRPELDP